ncbi:MAG: hypothetical protein AB7S56_07590 [Halothiobacillaceae bacterium]
MATLTVQNIDDDLEASLRQRAAQHGQSMQEEMLLILREALEQSSIHDAWFRAHVEDALIEADSPNMIWLSNDELKQQSTLHRQRWMQRAEHAGSHGADTL